MVKADRLLGIINLDDDERSLCPLTTSRPLATIPFGGRYRIIDFVLSNFVGAGVSTVGIFLKDRERSLMDHLRSGKPWDLDGNSGGLFMFSPYGTPSKIHDLQGDIMTIYNNRDFFHKAKEKYIVLSNTRMIANIDFSRVLDEHVNSGNDITVIYKKFDKLSHYYDNAFVINDDSEGRVKSFGIKIVKDYDSDSQDKAKVSLDMFIMEKNLFMKLIEDAVSVDQNVYLREVIQGACRDYNMYGYEYKGFIGFINSIKNYFETSMDLLSEENLMDLFYGENRIITKSKNESPAFYSKKSSVTNSLIGNGCTIEGEVKNSILFRRVRVEKGARIENSIIMQNSIIRKDADLSNVILDKNVEVTEKAQIRGTKKNPLVIEKGSVV